MRKSLTEQHKNVQKIVFKFIADAEESKLMNDAIQRRFLYHLFVASASQLLRIYDRVQMCPNRTEHVIDSSLRRTARAHIETKMSFVVYFFIVASTACVFCQQTLFLSHSHCFNR